MWNISTKRLWVTRLLIIYLRLSGLHQQRRNYITVRTLVLSDIKLAWIQNNPVVKMQPKCWTTPSKRTSTLTHLALIIWTYIKNAFFLHLLTMSTPVDDFLLTYSRRFISQMNIEGRHVCPLLQRNAHWCFKALRTEVSTIPLRNCVRICGRDSQSPWTIASFHAAFSSSHPQKREAVDGATGRHAELF